MKLGLFYLILFYLPFNGVGKWGARGRGVGVGGRHLGRYGWELGFMYEYLLLFSSLLFSNSSSFFCVAFFLEVGRKEGGRGGGFILNFFNLGGLGWGCAREMWGWGNGGMV